jgi:hypothetical protein
MLLYGSDDAFGVFGLRELVRVDAERDCRVGVAELLADEDDIRSPAR